MSNKAILAIILVMVCFSPVFLNAQTDPNNWDKLNLSSTTIAGTKVYYEKSFEPNLPFFENRYKQFLAEKNKIDSILTQKNQILADINEILGIKDANMLVQNEILSKLIDGFSSIKIEPIYIVKTSTIKDFLKEGEKLPKLSYNKTNDLVEYNFNVEFTDKDKGSKDIEFVFIIKSPEIFENSIIEQFNILELGFKNICSGITFHEIAEFTLSIYVKPDDPYWRWFNEGVANNIAHVLVKKYIGDEDANDFISIYDVNECIDLKNEINLKYWMPVNLCILPRELPTNSGKKFIDARYSYATFEIQRLVEKFGIECISKILDDITKKESRTSNDLIAAIKKVTNEDMNLRLTSYQSFEQKQEGIQKYAAIHNEAKTKNGYEQMIFTLLRAHELRSPLNLQQYIQDYIFVSIYLFKMGIEKDADNVMNNCMELCSSLKIDNSRLLALDAFIIYALGCNKPLKAVEAAKELEQLAPDNINSLTVNLLICLENNKPDEAIELAKKIISLSKDKNSLGYSVASSILSYDQNQAKPTQ